MSDGMPNTDGVSARTGVWFAGARGSVAAMADAGAARDRLEATAVRDLLLDLAGVPARTRSLT